MHVHCVCMCAHVHECVCVCVPVYMIGYVSIHVYHFRQKNHQVEAQGWPGVWELRWLDAAVLTGDPKPREGLDMSWTLLKVLL